MDDFQEHYFKHYEENLDTILRMRELTSGIHRIDIEKDELWIESQLSERRRRAAFNLINNTHYITFNEVFEMTRELVDKVKDLSHKNPLLIVGEKNKSSYFMSIIFIYIWNLKEYGEINVIKTLDYDIIIKLKNDNIIIIDDVSYTGGQTNVILTSNKTKFLNYCLNNNCMSDYKLIYSLNINICFIGATKRAINLINSSQPKLNIYVSKIYDNLYDLLNTEDYMDLIYYFSPVTFYGPALFRS